jgi:hypothetical protein
MIYISRPYTRYFNFRFYNPISPSLRFIINTVAKRTSRLDEQAGPSTRGRRE